MRGQALILFMVALLVLCLGVIVLFNTGQAVTKKVQLVNTADAAAYSAAIQEARALNLVAYMNRASVANEVAVAQMVSWYSWMNFALRGTQNFKNAVQAIAIVFDITVVLAEVGAALQEVVTVLNGVKKAIKAARNAFQIGFSAAVTAINALNMLYSKSSWVIANAGSADIFPLVSSVVRKNTDGQAKIGWRGKVLLGEGVVGALSYVRTYSIPKGRHAKRTNDADRYLNVVMAARDGFSRDRSDEIAIHIPLVGSFGLYKRGWADLINYTNWVSLDSLDAKAEMFCAPFFGCAIDFDVPLAWGGGSVKKNRSRLRFARLAKPGINQGHGWDSPYQIDHGGHKPYAGGMDNGKAGWLAVRNPAMGGSRKAWLTDYLPVPRSHKPGLQDYQGIVENKATVPYDNGASASRNGVEAMDVGPIFTVLVEQSMDTVHTSDNIDGIGGPPDFEAPDKTVGEQMTALSSAQVYFDRSRSLFPNLFSQDKRELGNLFSPYWQARLVDTPCLIRQQVAVSYKTVAPCL